MYEEESDSEPEIDESGYAPEEEYIEEEKEQGKRQSALKRKNKMFDYLNKVAKRNK